jgi:hypothetical protein
MIKLWFYNFGYFGQTEYATLEEAKIGARKAGFDCTFVQGDQTIGSWSILSGFRSYL